MTLRLGGSSSVLFPFVEGDRCSSAFYLRRNVHYNEPAGLQLRATVLVFNKLRANRFFQRTSPVRLARCVDQLNPPLCGCCYPLCTAGLTVLHWMIWLLAHHQRLRGSAAGTRHEMGSAVPGY
jgi:hypothetical protein